MILVCQRDRKLSMTESGHSRRYCHVRSFFRGGHHADRVPVS
jgi:hypothetical protein